MRKLLLVIAVVMIAASLFANVTPYGSGRVGFWYNMTDEDHKDGERTNFTQHLQTNSRFGVDFRTSEYIAKVEFGAAGLKDGNVGVNIRHLWVRKALNGFTLTVGQMDDGINQLSNQVWKEDLGLVGYGAMDGSRNPAIRADLTSGSVKGLYFALIKPSAPDSVDILFPKINVGWEGKAGNVTLKPSLMFQMYSWDKDLYPNNDASLMSCLVSMTGEYKDNKLSTKAQVNYGINAGDMGFSKNSKNTYLWKTKDDGKQEISDTTTLGGYVQGGFDIQDDLYLGLGVGYSQDNNDEWEEADARMGVYIQAVCKQFGFRLIPEIGMMNEMKDNAGNKQGSNIYFGTQLRYDF